MDANSLLDAAFGIIMFLFGFILRVIWYAMDRLRRDLTALEVKLPETYATKLDIVDRFDRLDTALERIYKALDGKQDRRATDRVGH